MCIRERCVRAQNCLSQAGAGLALPVGQVQADSDSDLSAGLRHRDPPASAGIKGRTPPPLPTIIQTQSCKTQDSFPPWQTDTELILSLGRKLQGESLSQGSPDLFLPGAPMKQPQREPPCPLFTGFLARWEERVLKAPLLGEFPVPLSFFGTFRTKIYGSQRQLQ